MPLAGSGKLKDDDGERDDASEGKRLATIHG